MRTALSILLVVVIVVIATAIAGHIDGYRQGQIDALTGKIEFQLVTHPDSTRTWEKIDISVREFTGKPKFSRLSKGKYTWTKEQKPD